MLSDSISDRTIALLFLYNSVATKLMYRLICNLPELSIRIFNPITSYFLINRYESRVSESRKILYHHNAYELFTLHSSFFT